MRILTLIAALLISSSAQAARPSVASIEALLTATKAERLMDNVYAGVEQMMRSALKQNFQGKSLTAEQQRALDVMPAKFASVMREEMSWQKIKPHYVQIYLETFEQEEVDGMLAFYATPAGKALVDKTPVVMQKSLALSQYLVQSILPKMKAAMAEAVKEAEPPANK